jgi:hypothetical protein
MGKYRIVTMEQSERGGFETRISGPGIPSSGVVYWFENEPEAHCFIENLNLSYFEGKRLLKSRKSFPERMKAAAAV